MIYCRKVVAGNHQGLTWGAEARELLARIELISVPEEL
jgi:hypothetical protein